MNNIDIKPVKQEPWPDQFKSLNAKRQRKPTDEMSIANIVDMFNKKEFLCDVCGGHMDWDEIQNIMLLSPLEHILHIINPLIRWVCVKCYENDKQNGRIIAEG